MSRVYRQVHAHTGATVNAGAFAEKQVELKLNPSAGDWIQIVWNGVTRRYTFVDDGSGVDHIRATTARPSTKINIGSSARDNALNFASTVCTNVDHVAAGKDDTILPVVRQSSGSGKPWVVDIYSQSKIAGSLNIIGTGTSSVSVGTPGVAPTGAYSTNTGFIGIMLAGSHGAQVSTNLLMIKSDTSGVAGAPENDLEVVSVNLRAGILYEIATHGCSTNCTVFG